MSELYKQFLIDTGLAWWDVSEEDFLQELKTTTYNELVAKTIKEFEEV